MTLKLSIVCLLAALSLGGAAAVDTAGSRVSDSLTVMGQKALSKPYQFFRDKGPAEMFSLLESSPGAKPGFSADSLADVRAAAENRRRYYLTCAAGVLQYAVNRTDSPEQACRDLTALGETAIRQTKNIALAEALLTGAARMKCADAESALLRVTHWRMNDAPVDSFLNLPRRHKKEDERHAYIANLREFLEYYPETNLKPLAFKRIGDVYFELNLHRKMARWYQKAVDLDPSLSKNTPIGYRLKSARTRIKHESIAYGAMGIYGAVILLLLVRAVRSRGSFRWRHFARRTVILLAIYLGLAAAVFVIDAFTTGDTALNLGTTEKYRKYVVEPVVPFSVMDGSNLKLAARILTTGFLPLLFIALYTSFIRPYSRLLLLTAVLLGSSALWIHFYLVTTFDKQMYNLTFRTGGRLYYNGELEEELTRNPRKVLKANPDFVNAENSDLELFLKKRFPDGLPGADQ